MEPEATEQEKKFAMWLRDRIDLNDPWHWYLEMAREGIRVVKESE